MHSLITVRQTADPYIDDIQYIASRDVTLEPDGTLSMSKIGLGAPGDKFAIIERREDPGNPFPLVIVSYPRSDTVHAERIQWMASYEDGPYPILTIVEKGDEISGLERFLRRMDARIREEQIAYLRGLVAQARNRLASIFAPLSTPITSMASQRPDSIPFTHEDPQPWSVSTCVSDISSASVLVHRRRGADSSL